MLALLLLAGCGGSGGSHTAASPSTATGSVSPAALGATSLPAGAGCAAVVADTLGRVAARIYAQAATGGNALAALRGAQSSAALRSAVAAGDATAVRAAAAPALNGPTVRFRVQASGRLLADLGSAPALAPASGVLRGGGSKTLGEVTVSVQGQAQYVSTVQRLTGAPVLLGAHVPGLGAPTPATGLSATAVQRATRYRGRPYRMVSFAGRAFPAGELTISLLAPARPPSSLCRSSPADTRASTIAAVAKRIYAQELSSGEVTAALRYVQHSRAFADAVARADAGATRTAIRSFFQTHIHIVRVRAFHGSRLVTDLGGPHVLAPVSGTLAGSGDHFLLAIQDDAGYVKLVRRFTGAEALLIAGGRPAASSLSPPPGAVPTSGTVRIQGIAYRVSSFPVTAFPGGPLLASILVPGRL